MDYELLLLKLLSPIEFAICFIIILFAKGRFWAVPIAALAAAISSAFLPSLGSDERSFWYSLAACCVQAGVIYVLFLLKDKFFPK